MGFNDFFLREDVYEIIKNTLSKHYDIHVKIINTRFKRINTNTYYCIPYLNVIFRNGICKRELKQFLKSNMIGNQSRLKRLILRLYIEFALFLPRLFSDKLLEVSNKNQIDVIFPGNKKIKVIDFSQKLIKNILKVGFDDEWFNKEVNFRKNSTYSFVLGIELTGEGYYVEKLLSGKPLARMNAKTILRLESKIFKCLGYLSNDSKKLPMAKYISSLSNEVKDLLYKNIFKENQYILKIVTLLINYLNSVTQDNYIVVHTTHGDFQKGNVFIDNTDKLYILDWETFDVRYCNYDVLVYLFNMRNSYNLTANFQKYFNKNGKSKHYLIELSLFILEDLKWYLKETTQLIKGNHSLGLTNYNKAEVLNYLTLLYSLPNINITIM